METQGELGWVGFLLIAGFFGLVLIIGAMRALREPDPQRRLIYAAATAGVAAFVTAAAVEWVWEMAVFPMIVLVLAATILSGSRPRLVRLGRADTQRRGPSRLVIALLALPAVVAIAIPLASTSAVRDSQAAVRHNDPKTALADARTAASIQPSAATPDLQEALIFERAGRLDQAARSARTATRHEPTNWRPWITLSRIEAERGSAAASVAAYRRARVLDRRSPLFPAR
jgi:Flp pilus assembly protein TadD